MRDRWPEAKRGAPPPGYGRFKYVAGGIAFLIFFLWLTGIRLGIVDDWHPFDRPEEENAVDE